ncbi:MAG: ABC transporter substrate-binding protein [Deltaproteobacteria bacterium]|nr:ABC transporter substrate-binding protein [Deltaproteobacteria bacterium]
MKIQDLHPRILDLKSDLEKGKITRRQFMRYSTLLGFSTAASSGLMQMMRPQEAHAVTYGGKLKVSGILTGIKHPAQAKWLSPSQIYRNIAEYLTFTDVNNITRPYLLQGWEADDDLLTWTLYLRKGIFFNNAHELTADDVIFSFGQWLDREVGSPMAAIIGAYLDPTGIERVSRYQVRLHLNRPEIALPEHLFYYPAVILNHRTFEGNFLKTPHGTGPFTLDTFQEGERCILKKRMNYWQPGLPFLSEIEFIDLGFDISKRVTALKAGKIDVADLSGADELNAFQMLKGDPRIHIESIATARVNVLRMRVDREPWQDNRVRTALKLCQHREKIMLLAGMKQGHIGHDCHVFPGHPEFCRKPDIKFDPRQARSILREAGYPDGLDVTLTIGDKWPDIQRYAEILQRDAAEAGFRISIDTIPNQNYRQSFREVDFGITPWTHRPLGTMVLNLAYTADAEGVPMPLNETRWVDEEFSNLLAKANATLDLKERRKLFCTLQDIQMERGSIGIAWWQNRWTGVLKKVQGLKSHPSGYLLLDRVWLKKRRHHA